MQETAQRRQAGALDWTRLSRVGLRVSLGLCDQALFAGSSFLFTLLLARWMSSTDFGAFAVAYSIYMLLQNGFDGLMSEPLAIFGANQFAGFFPAYFGRILIGHAILSIALILLIGTASALMLLFDAGELAGAFAGLGIAVPFLSIRSLIRQPFYMTMRLGHSVAVGAANLLFSASVLWALHVNETLTPLSAFLALACGSGLAAGSGILFCFRPQWHLAAPELRWAALARMHFAYGRWALSERALLWLQTNVAYIVLPIAAGLHASAAYRAANTLAMPAFLATVTAMTMLLPMLARSESRDPASRWQKYLMPSALLSSFIYGGLLAAIGPAASHALFAGQYDTELDRSLMAGLGLGVVIFATNSIAEVRLRARLELRQVVAGRMAATAFALSAGLGLVVVFKLNGAVIALALTWLATTAVLQSARFRRDRANAQIRPALQG